MGKYWLIVAVGAAPVDMVRHQRDPGTMFQFASRFRARPLCLKRETAPAPSQGLIFVVVFFLLLLLLLLCMVFTVEPVTLDPVTLPGCHVVRDYLSMHEK